jgi:DNA primase
VRHLITLLLHQPELAQLVASPAALDDIELPGIDLLADLLTFLHEQPDARTGTILEHWREHEHGGHLAKLAQATFHLQDHHLEAEFNDTFRKLDKYRRSSPEQILAKIARGETPTDEEKLILKETAQSKASQAQKSVT